MKNCYSILTYCTYTEARTHARNYRKYDTAHYRRYLDALPKCKYVNMKVSVYLYPNQFNDIYKNVEEMQKSKFYPSVTLNAKHLIETVLFNFP